MERTRLRYGNRSNSKYKLQKTEFECIENHSYNRNDVRPSGVGDMARIFHQPGSIDYAHIGSLDLSDNVLFCCGRLLLYEKPEKVHRANVPFCRDIAFSVCVLFVQLYRPAVFCSVCSRFAVQSNRRFMGFRLGIGLDSRSRFQTEIPDKNFA